MEDYTNDKRALTSAISVPGILASSALGGLGGFVYDRYIRKNKDVKSNLLKSLLFGGGSALAYGAYTVAAEKVRQDRNTASVEAAKKDGKTSAKIRTPSGNDLVVNVKTGERDKNSLETYFDSNSRPTAVGGSTLLSYLAGSTLRNYVRGKADVAALQAHIKESGTINALPEDATSMLEASAERVLQAKQRAAKSQSPKNSNVIIGTVHTNTSDEAPKVHVTEREIKEQFARDYANSSNPKERIVAQKILGRPLNEVTFFGKTYKLPLLPAWRVGRASGLRVSDVKGSGRNATVEMSVPVKYGKDGTTDVKVRLRGSQNPRMRSMIMPNLFNVPLGILGFTGSLGASDPEFQEHLRNGEGTEAADRFFKAMLFQ